MHLFPHQIDGIEWLASKRRALLADEPGLGKTAQAILAAEKIGAKKILVVCPAVARIVWDGEIRKFSSSLQKPIVVSKRQTLIPLGASVIISYDLAVRVKDLGTFDVVILDEAHYVKSPVAKRTQSTMGKGGAVRRAPRTWCLTGTPMPNHAGELWVLLYTFGVTKLKYRDFLDRYCIVDDLGSVRGTKREMISEIKELLSSIMLRRTKDVISLPPIVYSTISVEAGNVGFTYEETQIVREQLRLLDLNFGADAILRVMEANAGSVATLRRYLGMQKVEAMVQLAKNDLDADPRQKIIIFAVHRQVIRALYGALCDYGAVILNGDTSPIGREVAVDSFQNDPDTRIFIGNIKAAGTAITLTASDRVYFVEQEWVPGDNTQAAQRCHRIGQTKSVNAIFVTISGSLDEKIGAILARKASDIRAVFD